ncbi:MAG: PAS domain-containing protein, partial [Oscillospiraceae bacterium]
YRADAARIAFANENLPGGMLGGYLEKGLPLYFINDCMLRYLGYPDKEAFIAATDGLLVNCIYDEDRPAVLDAIRRGLSENGEYEFTHRIKKQDGGYLWVNEIGKRIVAEDGKPSIICLCMDVSPQMELRNQLNLYRSAARGGAFVVRIDEDFTLLYGNDIFYDVYGYPKPSKAEEPDRVQTKCVNYIHPDDLPYVRQLVHDSVAAGKTTLQWEMRIVTGSDRLRWLLTTGTLEYRGKELVMNGFITEITELHELREKLARDEQRYRIALRQINTNVWEYDLRTRAVSMTESAEEKHGHLGHLENVPESLIQSGYIHPSSHADFRALYQKLYDGEKCAQADILTQTADKTGWWWERITYTTIFDVAGAPIRAVAVGEDITHQKEAEIKYQQELQMRYTLLQGLIASSKVNLSTNTVELLQGDSQPASVPPNRMTYTDLFELGLQHISNPNDRERYSAIFTRAALQTAFEQH